MDCGDYYYYWGLYRDYYGDPSPHSLLRTRESFALPKHSLLGLERTYMELPNLASNLNPKSLNP